MRNAAPSDSRDTMNADVLMERVMKPFLAGAIFWLGFSFPAYAALDIGDKAPDFTTQAALGGSVYKFSLAESLSKGPVVLYFFPAAYSEGCSVEAHYFADATADFKALGASVVGVSGDDIETLTKFSVQACQSRFPVASDQTQSVMQVLVDAESHKILGASLLGIEADEAIHCIIDVMNAGAPYTAIRRAVHIHPTVSELIPTLLGEMQPLR